MRIALGSIEIARFTAADTRALYTVRNAPSVRPFMADPAMIPYRSHVAWVRHNLLETDTVVVFMVRLRGRAIGFTSLKRVTPDTSEIGVMFRESTTHQVVSYSAVVATLYWAFERQHLRFLTSYVVPGHDRALGVNLSFGAWRIVSDKPELIQLRLSREICLASDSYRTLFPRLQARMVMSTE